MASRLRIASALAMLACASPPMTRVELCSPPEELPERPSAECFHEPNAQRYVGRIGTSIGDSLSGWRSHPGTAELSVRFDDDGRVASICYDSYQGDVIAQRIPLAAERALRLDPAPACFAGRRLDFAWESDVVTGHEVRAAVANCQRQVERFRRRNHFCHETQRCPVEEVRARWEQADRALRSCVLDEVPLAMRTGTSRELLHFEPAAGNKPDPELALRAFHVCDGLPRRPDVIECMGRHGWQPRR